MEDKSVCEWTCAACYQRIPAGATHQCSPQYQATNKYPYVYVDPAVLERIANALEKIAERPAA